MLHSMVMNFYKAACFFFSFWSWLNSLIEKKNSYFEISGVKETLSESQGPRASDTSVHRSAGSRVFY